VPVPDDAALDKPHAKRIDLAGRHRPGKHKRAARRTGLASLARADGGRFIPYDYRAYHDAKAATRGWPT
jgi:hypothetical protein